MSRVMSRELSRCRWCGRMLQSLSTPFASQILLSGLRNKVRAPRYHRRPGLHVQCVPTDSNRQ